MSDGFPPLMEELRQFRDEREWDRYHDPKNLAMAVAGEAGELVAELQWLTSAEAGALAADHRERVAEEAADVLIYLLYLADSLKVDLAATARAKVRANQVRFPIPTTEAST